jgi:hypothetical protein
MSLRWTSASAIAAVVVPTSRMIESPLETSPAAKAPIASF